MEDRGNHPELEGLVYPPFECAHQITQETSAIVILRSKACIRHPGRAELIEAAGTCMAIKFERQPTQRAHPGGGRDGGNVRLALDKSRR